MDRQLFLSELAAAISDQRLAHPVRVAIDGVDGVGKTTIADELAEPVRKLGREVIRASIDGFHNPRQRRYVRGADSPEGYFLDSFDYEALERELLRPLGPNGDRRYRGTVFDYRIDSAVVSASQDAVPDAVLLFDGVFLLRPELLSHWDLKIWVDAPFDVTVERAVQRDSARNGKLEELRKMYQRRYVLGQRIYLERCQPKQRADIVVNNIDISSPELEFRNA
jgi:uridine kinase